MQWQQSQLSFRCYPVFPFHNQLLVLIFFQFIVLFSISFSADKIWPMTIDHDKQFFRGKHFVRDRTPGQNIGRWTNNLSAISKSSILFYRARHGVANLKNRSDFSYTAPRGTFPGRKPRGTSVIRHGDKPKIKFICQNSPARTVRCLNSTFPCST